MNYNCINESNIIKINDLTHNFIKTSISILDLIPEFILIIDFYNRTGGTRFFLDAIISYYKSNTVFVVARNINGNITLFINNEYEIENKLNTEESINFIENYKDKISKIFFNHTIDHSRQFIYHLFKLNKHTTYITHDYFLINSNPQSYYADLPLKQTNYLRFDSFDKIITQHQTNINIFKRYTNKQIDIIELPDFKRSHQNITTNNANTVIGIIGGVSNVKGRCILENIIKFYRDKDISIVVFGYVEIEGFHNHHSYTSNKDLNALFVKYKPNILLELSLWPETYSYTLSLAMLTNLPILCLKKKFPSVVENRLQDYGKAYFFSNHNNLDILVNKHKQNYFYTIEDTIFIEKKWDEYFNIQKINNPKPYFNNINNKNIVFVTSKIIVSNNKFSYVKKRSYYSKEERFMQTIDTIKSIRAHIQDAHIVLLDNSIFNYFEYQTISNIVDTFINITDDPTLNYFTDVFEYKAFGEINQTLKFFDLFFSVDFSKIKNFFKITGRYKIDNSFNYEQYDNNLNIFKKHLTIKNKEFYYTCFYKLDKSILKDVQTIFIDFVKNKEAYMNSYSDLEVILPNAIIDRITVVDNLGIVENIGVWKKIENI